MTKHLNKNDKQTRKSSNTKVTINTNSQHNIDLHHDKTSCFSAVYTERKLMESECIFTDSASSDGEQEEKRDSDEDSEYHSHCSDNEWFPSYYSHSCLGNSENDNEYEAEIERKERENMKWERKKTGRALPCRENMTPAELQREELEYTGGLSTEEYHKKVQKEVAVARETEIYNSQKFGTKNFWDDDDNDSNSESDEDENTKALKQIMVYVNKSKPTELTMRQHIEELFSEIAREEDDSDSEEKESYEEGIDIIYNGTTYNINQEQVEEIKCSHLAGADNSKQKRLAIRQHIEQLFFEYIREEEDSSNSDCEEANATDEYELKKSNTKFCWDGNNRVTVKVRKVLPIDCEETKEERDSEEEKENTKESESESYDSYDDEEWMTGRFFPRLEDWQLHPATLRTTLRQQEQLCLEILAVVEQIAVPGYDPRNQIELAAGQIRIDENRRKWKDKNDLANQMTTP